MFLEEHFEETNGERGNDIRHLQLGTESLELS